MPPDIAETKSAAKIQRFAEAMVQADVRHIGHTSFIVVVGQTIPSTPVDPHGFTVKKREPLVRDVVFVLKKVAEGHLGRRTEAEGESRSEALAGDFDMISVDDIGVLGHGVYPQSDRGRERLVDVRGAAEVRAAAGAGRPVVEALETGALLTWLMIPPVEPRPK